jgi:hypothetical protein
LAKGKDVNEHMNKIDELIQENKDLEKKIIVKVKLTKYPSNYTYL